MRIGVKILAFVKENTYLRQKMKHPLILIIIVWLMTAISVSGGEHRKEPSVRPMAVAGQFYPADKDTLHSQVTQYLMAAGKPAQETGGGARTIASGEAGEPASPSTEGAATYVQSVIVPHAGYVFSAATAAYAYACLSPHKTYKHIFLLGPSHHLAFDGASVDTAYDYYQTPLGRVRVDRALARSLVEEHPCFRYEPEVHGPEHCLEVQLPFLQVRLDTMPPVVPVIIGTLDLSRLRAIARALAPWYNEDNLFVISSDFCHYPGYDDACRVDKATGEAVAGGSVAALLDTVKANLHAGIPNLATSACGLCAILIDKMMADADTTAVTRHLHYSNSGDSPYGGRDQVVGYHAFVTTRRSLSDFRLMDADRKQLLHIARRSITAGCRGDAVDAGGGAAGKEEDGRGLSESLSTCCGAFVTLHKNGRLRGCVGHFGSDVPLHAVVREMAYAAAFEDPRFHPVTAEELPDIRIEISVLTPLRRIRDIREFDYGRQGIFIRKGAHSGTFLPQVAEETHWTKEEFLGHCARDKAGIGWDGWKEAELYTYEAILFHE